MSESLQQYLAARREANKAKRAQRMVVPVPGYEARLAARYRIIEFDEKREIQQRHDKIGTLGDGQDLINASADLIVKSCEDLMEITDPGDPKANPPVAPSYQSLGKRWMAPDIAELFGVDIAPGPQGTSAIMALRMVLDGEQIMAHFGEITNRTDEILSEAEEETQGEAVPSVEG